MTWYGLDHSYIVDLIAQDPQTFVGTGMVSAVSDVRLPDPDKAMVALAARGIYAFRVRGQPGAGRPSATVRAGWTTPATSGCLPPAPSTISP